MRKVDKKLSEWIDKKGPEADVVMSSRIRLARNMAGVPFSPLMNGPLTEAIFEEISEVLAGPVVQKLGKYELARLDEYSELDRKVLIAKHLISPRLDQNYQQAAIAIKEDELANIMINEEDHIRIQAIRSGLNLDLAYQEANRIDDALESKIDYAFDEQWGYITSCPTNMGTGLRASVMVHIPGLILTGQAPKVLETIHRIGLAVRGYYGEGSQAIGNVYQISNQLTLGYSEAEIIDNLDRVVQQIIEHERYARDRLLQRSRVALEDTIFRSLGILEQARIIRTDEAMQRISDVRLGIDLGILNGVSQTIMNELMLTTSSAYLNSTAGREMTDREREIMRADVIRDRLAQCRINEANTIQQIDDKIEEKLQEVESRIIESKERIKKEVKRPSIEIQEENIEIVEKDRGGQENDE